jgi:hypothetical protein
MPCFVIGLIILPKINILFLPYHNTGGHFIDWSVYFLSGQDHYFNPTTSTNDRLLVSPGVNATKNFHAHCSLIASGFKQLEENITKVCELGLPVVNIYVCLLNLYTTIQDLFGVTIDQATPLQCKQAVDYVSTDTRNLLSWLPHESYPIAFFDYHKNDFLNIFYNDRQPCDFSNNPLASSDEFYKLWTDTFFEDSSKHFDQTVWDRREQLALITRPVCDQSYYSLFDHTKPHLYYTTDDVWNDLPAVMSEMLEFFDLPIDRDRLEKWLPIYNTWRVKHDPYFSRHYNRILDAIVNNHYINLRRFNLNFYKEVLIQQGLITKYNLNLKTWQLIRFPSDTQALHKLLEPNIHAL